MRENRSYGSEGGEPQVNAAFLPLSLSCRELAAVSASFTPRFLLRLGLLRRLIGNRGRRSDR